MRKVIQGIFIVIIIILGYLIIGSIMEPIDFEEEVAKRENVTIDRLIDIRDAQKAYKDVYKKYTGSFDTLIAFVDTGNFIVVKAIGEIPEEWLDEMGDYEAARKRAIKEGKISREPTKVPVLDSLYGADFAYDSLRYVPFCDTLQFTMEASEIVTSSNLTIQVVEAYVMYDNLLHGMDAQLVVNYKDKRNLIVGFEGVKFGSLDEGTLTGNWE